MRIFFTFLKILNLGYSQVRIILIRTPVEKNLVRKRGMKPVYKKTICPSFGKVKKALASTVVLWARNALDKISQWIMKNSFKKNVALATHWVALRMTYYGKMILQKILKMMKIRSAVSPVTFTIGRKKLNYLSNSFCPEWLFQIFSAHFTCHYYAHLVGNGILLGLPLRIQCKQINNFSSRIFCLPVCNRMCIIILFFFSFFFWHADIFEVESYYQKKQFTTGSLVG